jgi:hypothetical protein
VLPLSFRFTMVSRLARYSTLNMEKDPYRKALLSEIKRRIACCKSIVVSVEHATCFSETVEESFRGPHRVVQT